MITCTKFTKTLKRFLFILWMWTPAAAAMAQKNPVLPRLVVYVLLDELGNDQLTLLEDRFSTDGFNRIKRSGFVFRNARGNSLTGFPGSHIASLLTGTEPSVHGVIDRSWLDHRTGEVQEALHQPSGGIAFPNISTKVPSLPDYLRLFWGRQVQVAGITANFPEIAYSLGSTPDYYLELDKRSGRFHDRLSSEADTVGWLQAFNGKGLAPLFSEREWGPMMDISSYREFRFLSDADAKDDFRSFYYDLSPPKKGKVQPFEALSASPFGNMLVRDMAVSFLMNSSFGRDEIPDFLVLGFTNKPYFRPNGGFLSVEKEDMLLRLDKELAEFMNFLDENYGRESYLMVLASGSAPSFLREKAGSQYQHEGALFEPRKAASLLNLYLMALYGQGKWVWGVNAGHLYLNHQLIEDEGLDLLKLQQQSVDFLMQVSGVELAVRNVDLALLSGPGHLHRLMWDNYFPGRSGDVIFTLRPGWSYLNSATGHPQNGVMGRSTLPLMVSGWKVKPGQFTQEITYAGLMPLLLQAFGLDVPAYSQWNEPVLGEDEARFHTY